MAEDDGDGLDEGGVVVGAEVADELVAEVDGFGFTTIQVAPDGLEHVVGNALGDDLVYLFVYSRTCLTNSHFITHLSAL